MVSGSQLQVAKLAQMCPSAPSGTQQRTTVPGSKPRQSKNRVEQNPCRAKPGQSKTRVEQNLGRAKPRQSKTRVEQNPVRAKPGQSKIRVEQNPGGAPWSTLEQLEHQMSFFKKSRGGSSLFFLARAEPSQNIFEPSEPRAFRFLLQAFQSQKNFYSSLV